MECCARFSAKGVTLWILWCIFPSCKPATPARLVRSGAGARRGEAADGDIDGPAFADAAGAAYPRIAAARE